MKKLSALLVAGLLTLGACGVASQASPSKVTVTEDEFSVKLSQASAPAGKVTFVLNNTGKIEHELVILKTDLPHDKIPARDNDPTKVQEPGAAGEIEDVAAGTSKEETFDLTPGNYVLLCNVETHYAAGMHIAFVVK